MQATPNTARPLITRRGFAAMSATFALAAAAGTTVSGLLAAIADAAPATTDDENAKFDAITHQIVLDTVTVDVLTMQQFVSDPAAVGINLPDVPTSFAGSYGPEANATTVARAEGYLAQLNQINSDALDHRRADIRETLLRKYNLVAALHAPQFDYYDQAFQGDHAFQSTYPIVFDSLDIRDQEEAEIMVSVLENTLPEVQRLCDYSREQAKQGLLLADVVDILDDCEKFMADEFLTWFKGVLVKKVEGAGMDSATTASYRDRIAAAIDESYVPAYQLIVQTFTELRDAGLADKKTLHDLPAGREYYELLWRDHSGFDTTVDEGRWFLIGNAAKAVLDFFGARIFGNSNKEELVLQFKSYDEILEQLTGAVKGRFPEIPPIKYQIINGDPQLMEGSGGYFVVPPIDADTQYQIRVNPNGVALDQLETYTTVAHEGVPGHMYMYAYDRLTMPMEYGALLDDIAYIEGYASYVEGLSPSFLEGADPSLAKRNTCTLIIDRCMSGLFDIMLNYDGMNLGEAADTALNALLVVVDALSEKPADTANTAVAEPPMSAADMFLEIFGGNPAIITPYAAGVVEFTNLREHAEKELGDNFDELGFHEAILASGPVCFAAMERNVDAYIESRRK